MRLEYNENQEKELRITEIAAILENELYENEVEEHCLEIELQFLQGNKNTYGEPYAFIGTGINEKETCVESRTGDNICN